MDEFPHIKAKLEEWLSGYEIARKVVDTFGTTIVVTQEEDGTYSVFRAFSLGGVSREDDAAVVSCDLQGGTLEQAFELLLKNYK